MEKIYLLECNWLYKIWFTKWTVEKRVASMTTWNPHKISIIWDYDVVDWKKEEQKLHRRFSQKRKRWEWFNLCDRDIEYINTKLENNLEDRWEYYEFELIWESDWKFFYEAINQWFTWFNISIWANIYPLSAYAKMIWIQYQKLRAMLIKDVHDWLLESIEMWILKHAFCIWSKYKYWDNTKIPDKIKTYVQRNWFMFCLWDDNLSVLILVNPRYTE
jgi:hypothetical protein